MYPRRWLMLLAMTCSLQAEISLDDDLPAPAPRPSIIVPPAGRNGFADDQAQRQDDVLLFRNGDVLRGRLLGIDVAMNLSWRHPHLAELARVNYSGVQAVRLGFISATADDSGSRSRIELTNGDVLYGDVLSLNQSELVLNTSYAGQIPVRRAMLQAILPGNQRIAVYQGPKGLEEWVHSGRWKFLQSRLTGAGTIGKDVELPDLASVQFDVETATGHLNFRVMLYTNQIKRFGGDCYQLNVTGTAIHLSRYSNNMGTNGVGDVQVQQLASSKRAHFELLVNKEKKSFTLLVNGRKVDQWVDPHPFIGPGSGILFHTEDRAANLSFGNIYVAEWDGHTRAGDDNVDSDTQDLIEFVNGDKISGTLQQINAGEITFETPYAAMAIPLARVNRLRFAQADAECARRYAEDIAALFQDGGHVTIRLRRLENDRLVGSSQNFGEVSMALNVFSALRFDLYDDDGGEAPANLDIAPALPEPQIEWE